MREGSSCGLSPLLAPLLPLENAPLSGRTGAYVAFLAGTRTLTQPSLAGKYPAHGFSRPRVGRPSIATAYSFGQEPRPAKLSQADIALRTHEDAPMTTPEDKRRKTHRGAHDNLPQFASNFVRGRLAGFEKDMRICLKGTYKISNNRSVLTHAYFPALMSCCGTLEYLAGLHIGRVNRSVGVPNLIKYATKYLPQPAYSPDIVRVLFDAFRDPIAHHGIASGVWVDQHPETKGRRFVWKVLADARRPPLGVVAPGGVLKIDPPWDCPYTHRVHIRLGRLWRDIRDSGDGYIADLASSKDLQAKFRRCMEQLYPR